ncbi:EamA family transporter [Pectobacterium brasiliense]|uniref:EamA family transporter n=1 Tax=Pectobacterium brasiliense TaxID=180957 RepID=UPI0019695A5E|nr:EamA family transporter [Pectobacterium brasiliense]MBN3264378.1 EamA family transporter [Pectobacterium brasiliense]
MNKSVHLPLLAVFVSLISIQVGAAFAKSAFSVVGPFGMSALRVGIAMLLLAAVFKPWQLRTDKKGWKTLAIYGVMMGAMNILIYMSFKYIPVGIAISIEVLGPLTVAMLASRQKSDLVWISFAILGLLLLPLGSQNSSLDPRGITYVIAAAFCWGMYVRVGSKAAEFGSRGVAIGTVFASLFIVPIGIYQSGFALLIPDIFMLGFLIAIMSSALPFLLDIYALRRLSSNTFGILMSASPAVSALSGFFILGEKLSFAQSSGILAITVACMGATYCAKSKTVKNK